MIYLDHAAASPLTAQALAQLHFAYQNNYANPSAAHKLGAQLFKAIEDVRQNILASLGLSAETFGVIFTSSATEANSMIVHAAKVPLIYNPADHPSITKSIEVQTHQESWQFFYTPSGEIAYDHLQKCIERFSSSQLLLSHVNNSSGIMADVTRLADIKRSSSKLMIHLDLSQSYGKIDFTHIDLNCADSLALAAHKMGGPRGVAALVYRRTLPLVPLLQGGLQDSGLRSSTLNYPLIHSWDAAIREMTPLTQTAQARISKINQHLRQQLQADFPEIILPYAHHLCSPYILMLMIPKISSDILLRHLEAEAIYVSTSAACSSKIRQKNPVYLALGLPEEMHKNILRISFGQSTTEVEVESFFTKFTHIYQELKSYL